MGILLSFSPFIAFALLTRVLPVAAAVFVGAAVALALLAWERFGRKRGIKILEAGTVVLFGALALYAVLRDPDWSIVGVRLRVDVGLLLIVLLSMLLRRPFTLQYAREQVAPELWHRPLFIRTNYVITAVWAGAFVEVLVASSAPTRIINPAIKRATAK